MSSNMSILVKSILMPLSHVLAWLEAKQL